MAILTLDGPLPDAVAHFLDHNIGARGLAHWQWKYRHASPHRPLGVYHTDAAGAVTGFIGLMPTTLLEADRVEVPAAWLVDWVAGSGGLGVGLGLLRKIQSLVPLTLTLGGSTVARDMYTKLRWTQRPIADVYVLRLSGRAIADRGPVRRRPALRVPARIAGEVASRLRPVRRPPAPRGITLERVPRYGDAWDAVWAARRTELAPCMDRGAAELDWKFADYPDDQGYRCMLLRDGGAAVGHLVLRVDESRGSRRGRLVDLTWPASRPELCAWLVREGTWLLRQEGADYVQCTASHALVKQALAATRFTRASSLPIFHQKLPPDVPPPAGWYVTYLDCDRAWR